MKRYAAFLRGVMPTNCRMPELKAAFEKAGFTDVRTVLSSGNVVFGAPAAANSAIEKKAEAAILKLLGRPFLTIVRSAAELEQLLASDPFKGARIPKDAKRNVTFLKHAPREKLAPATHEGAAWLVGMKGLQMFSAHIPNNPDGPVFMKMIEKALGKEQTTRTWQTVEKVLGAAR